MSDNPITEMMTILQRAGRDNFKEGHVWEGAFCALVLALEPHCRTYRLLEVLPYRQGRLDRLDFLNAFANLGYYARSTQAQMTDIDGRLFPCLFIDKAGTPYVLLERLPDAIRLYDSKGLREVTAKSLGGIAGSLWVFEKYDENRSPTSVFMRAGTGYSWFRALMGRFKGTLAQVMTAGLILNVVALAAPLYIMLVYDRVIAAGALSALPMLTVGVGIAILFEWALRRIRSRGLSRLAARMDNIVSNAIFSHLIGLSPTLVERVSVASQIARIKTFEAVRDFFSGSAFLSILEIPFVALAAIAIFAIAGPLVFVPLFMAGLYCLLYFGVQRRVKVAIRLAAKATSARQQFSLETFEKIHGIRGYGLVNKWQERFRDLSGKEMVAHFHLNWLGMMAENIANALTLFSAVAIIGFGVHFVWAGAISTGALVASMILSWRILTPFYSLCTIIPRMEQLRHSIMQVNTLMDISTEEMEARSRARLRHMHGAVTFDHADLRYGEGGERIFADLNIAASPGEIVMITGENGAGKTSLLKMIKGLYPASAGAVQIDGFDIRQLDAADLRRQIAYIPQSPDFFNGSLLSNIKIGNPLAGEEEIRNALVQADAWEEIDQLPDKLDTVISRYDNVSLPASLIVRLSLARAYLHTAPILLIDELPNALLGGRVGQSLKAYLERVKGKRTVFMVTYRDDFIRLADITVTLNRGEKPQVVRNQQTLLAGQEAA